MTDELLPGALKRFQDAAWPLHQPQPHWNNGDVNLADPLYTRMRDALMATSRVGACTTKSKPPARIDIMDWLRDIDHATSVWDAARTTPLRLEALSDFSWTPDHVKLLNSMARRCAQWVNQARDILGDNPVVVPLHGAQCPICQQRTAYRLSAGERVRTAALTVSEHGAQCLACRARWNTPAEQAMFRKLMGITELA